MNKLESDGYNVIMGEVRMSDDPGDPWGSNLGWLFALADYAYAIDGEILPGYRPSPMGVDLAAPGFELDTLFELKLFFEDEDVRRVYHVLSRRGDLLRLAGRNY